MSDGFHVFLLSKWQKETLTKTQKINITNANLNTFCTALTETQTCFGPDNSFRMFSTSLPFLEDDKTGRFCMQSDWCADTNKTQKQALGATAIQAGQN